MDVAPFARAWAEAWAHAWRTHDAELVGTLYTEDSVFRSQPFRPPHEGAEGAAAYAAWAFEDEREARVWFAEPRVAAGESAAVEYWGISTAASGAVETIAGVALLRFGPDGRVVEQRDYWSRQSGATEPYEGWSRS